MSSLGSSPYARSEVSISLSDLYICDGIVNSTLDAQIALEVPDVDQQRIRLVLFPDYEDFKALWGEIDAVQQKRKKVLLSLRYLMYVVSYKVLMWVVEQVTSP